MLAPSVCIHFFLSSWSIETAAVFTKGDRYNREVRVIPVDFNDGQSVYADIQAEISDLDVAVLGETITITLYMCY